MDRVRAMLAVCCILLHVGGVTSQGASGDPCGLESAQRVIDMDSGWATTFKECFSLASGSRFFQ